MLLSLSPPFRALLVQSIAASLSPISSLENKLGSISTAGLPIGFLFDTFLPLAGPLGSGIVGPDGGLPEGGDAPGGPREGPAPGGPREGPAPGGPLLGPLDGPAPGGPRDGPAPGGPLEGPDADLPERGGPLDWPPPSIPDMKSSSSSSSS